MSKIFRLSLLFMFIGLIKAHSQQIEWQNVFNTHSDGAGAGISPNSLIDNTGRIRTVVVESDTLKLYQTIVNGNITNVISSDKRISDNYTPLIKIGENQQAIVFKAGPFPGQFWLLQIDQNSTIVRYVPLDLPQGIVFPKIHNLIYHNQELFLTITTNGNHYLMRINDDDSLTTVYNSNISIAYGEDYYRYQNGLIFSYINGNNHIIRNINTSLGILNWEQSISTNFGDLLSYKMVSNGNLLYSLGLERIWVDGLPVDQVNLSQLDVTSGEVQLQHVLNLPINCNNCSIAVNDFIYNATNNRLYLSYESGFPQLAILLLEIHPETFEITNQRFFNFTDNIEFFQLTKNSLTHIGPDGNLIFIYKSYENPTEQMNLHIVALDAALEILGSYEYFVDELDSIEHLTDVLNYDESRILITGIVPHQDPSISLEQCHYFQAMLNLEEMLSVEVKNPEITIDLYPNPAQNLVYINLAEAGGNILIYDLTGKLILKQFIHNKEQIIDVSSFESGLYFVRFSQYKDVIKKLVVK